MAELFAASQQWASRPADERFTSLPQMQDHFAKLRHESSAKVIASRNLTLVPEPDNKGLRVVGPQGMPFEPTHWSFGQLAKLGGAGSATAYLRTLPSPLAADCINYGLKVARDVEDVGVLLRSNGTNVLRAATGPDYGRIWNSDILNGLVRTVGDGVSGDWRVPGIRKVALTEVTKENTTLYAGDRDMFIFLADERNRIELPNRRGGKSGLLSRGFFLWNSEVGSTSFGLSTFLFDEVCGNRIVWGACEIKEFRMRHTAKAPVRFLEQITPALDTYSKGSTKNILEGIEAARKAHISNVDDFLANRFTKRMAETLNNQHILEEGRPIETLWDVSTAITARARSLEWQDERVALEREAGRVLDLAK